VHPASGKSHTGCAIVIGDAGPVLSVSTKQKIVTKSSTEGELVGLSDTASQAIHLRNLIIAQGYDVGPAIIYQDNMSCMALMKRGGPTSQRSRHINIRHFWLKERVSDHRAPWHRGDVRQHPDEARARIAVRSRAPRPNELGLVPSTSLLKHSD